MFHMGYPGTIGGPYIDHFVGDRVALPPQLARQFVEKIVMLPRAYQANDHAQSYKVLPVPPSRAALGLPDDRFVFCDFNQVLASRRGARSHGCYCVLSMRALTPHTHAVVTIAVQD